MRDMYDSTNPFDIPADASMVGGYIDGRYAWPQSGWDRFAHATQVRIATRATTNDGNCGDVERGDMTPLEAPEWVQMRRNSGVFASIYCNELFGWPDVRQAFHNAGIAEPPYWVARYNNVRVVPPGAVAKQYANETLTHHHYDLTVADDFWPGIDGGSSVTPQDETLVLEMARAFQLGQEGVRFSGDMRLSINNIENHVLQLQPAIDAVGQRMLDALAQQPVAQAQAIADALGPDLGAAVLAALKAKL